MKCARFGAWSGDHYRVDFPEWRGVGIGKGLAPVEATMGVLDCLDVTRGETAHWHSCLHFCHNMESIAMVEIDIYT